MYCRCALGSACRSTTGSTSIGRALAALICGSALIATPAGAAPVVATTQGRVQGELAGAAMFRGILAAAPTGALRWRPTAPVAPWAGVRDATVFGRSARSRPKRSAGTSRKARIAPRSTWRVRGWTAGPGAGAHPRPWRGLFRGIEPRRLRGYGARLYAAWRVVVVAANYRLGRLGFFAHPGPPCRAARRAGRQLLADGPGRRPPMGEAQYRALRRRPRAGHDRGCSAGGSSINALMAFARARGLFARASAIPAVSNATRPLARAEQEGLPSRPVPARRARMQRRSRGCGLDTGAILAADPGPPNFGAMVDGVYLPDEPR